VTGEAGVLAIQLPVVVGRRLNEVFGQHIEIGAGSVGGEAVFVEERLGAGYVSRKLRTARR
jgi:hypothetical protein